MRYAWLLAVLFLGGCAAKQHVASGSKLYIPFRCMSKIEFVKPCEPISASLARCKDVDVHYSCVSPKQEPPGPGAIPAVQKW